ncbi:hypothetical protein BJ875DRAFT_401497 [Amylocarpus encephaloides]|uniref:RTA1 domain protein n=1 Tax=Amylocarpus encephaloides TaxID=45428 RepID=A0A9P8C5I5_9HELO|nr:hypothetical protein BJ875DRAFT_401497 [Amylocarpus encephaloides]
MGDDGHYVPGSLWFYAPNKGAPVVWATLFAISMGMHAYQCTRYKCWKVTGIFPWASLLFVIGYVSREVGAFDYGNVKIFITSTVFIYAAPPLYELANYFILSRILYYVPYHSPIHPGRVFTTFGFLSSVIEALNANGIAYMANTTLSPKKQDIGKSLVKAALLLQLVVLFAFAFLAITFQRRCMKASLMPNNLRMPLSTLYISSSLIFVRTLFRTIEFFTTASLNFHDENLDPRSLSPVLRYECFFWIFEGVLMVLNSFIMNRWHPMRFLPRNNKIYLALDGITEVEGPGYEDKRHWLVTFVDPFDINGLLKGQKLEDKFWETHQDGRDTGVTASGDVVQGREQDKETAIGTANA